MPKITPDKLRAILADAEAQALGLGQSSDLQTEREDALLFYKGDMSKSMPVPTGRSQAVSMDVAETIEGLMPDLMEIFAAGDKAIEFTPVGKEDIKAAAQETDYVNHVFWQKNRGWDVMYTFIKDPLISKVGVVKVYWEEEEKEERETYRNLTEDAYMLLVNDPDVEIIEHTERVGYDIAEELGYGV